MKTILVSLVSDQTIPNVQLIKEKIVDGYLFITTETMEKKGVSDWIINASGIEGKEIKKINVDPFDYDLIVKEVGSQINDTDLYLVNLTGGTKLMSLAINDLFKSVNSELFYLSGKSNYVKLFPDKIKPFFKFKSTLSLEEYLKSYGFNINSKSEPEVLFEITEKLFNYYLHSFSKETDILPLTQLLSKRGKKIAALTDFPEISPFLNRIGFKPFSENCLSKAETKYLTGDWFEEYFFHLIKNLNPSKVSDIGTGWFIEKNGVTNEFDILFIHNDNLHLIECKTFIWKDIEEKKSIIAETIYKADSLKNKLGLFANTSIVTLSELTSPLLKEHLERAKESRVNVYGKEDLLDLTQLFNKLI